MFSTIIRRFSSADSQVQQHDDHDNRLANSYPRHHSQQHRQPQDGISGVFAPPVVRTASPLRPPPLDPVVLHGYKDNTPSSARLLSQPLAEEIRIMIPERLRIVDDWRLVYSLEQDGASLGTLYQKCRAMDGRRAGYVLVVKDAEGGTFGAYLSDYPHPAPTYYGNGECFLWRATTMPSLPPPPSADTTNLSRETTLAPSSSSASLGGASTVSGATSDLESIRFKAFPYSGVNEYYINCEARFLSVGAGDGHYGLWVNDALERGHSSRCDTFGNEPLSDEGEKFDVIGVELWAMGA